MLVCSFSFKRYARIHVSSAKLHVWNAFKAFWTSCKEYFMPELLSLGILEVQYSFVSCLKLPFLIANEDPLLLKLDLRRYLWLNPFQQSATMDSFFELSFCIPLVYRNENESFFWFLVSAGSTVQKTIWNMGRLCLYNYTLEQTGFTIQLIPL